jgi:hypothetical protein
VLVRRLLYGFIMDDVENASLDTLFMLPSETSAVDLASQCREAALQFANDSKHWGKAELTMWLTGVYAPLIRHTSKGEGESQLWPVPLLHDIDDRLIDRMMESARAEIVETLSGAVDQGSSSFVLRALIAGSVVRCEDGQGEPAWAPAAAARLADRVLSLFAVDYLTRFEDYETALFICSESQTVSFDEHARTHGVDRHDRPAQSVAAPRRRLTLPYPPLEREPTSCGHR